MGKKEKFSNLVMCLWGREGAEIGSPKLCHLGLRLKLVKGHNSSQMYNSEPIETNKQTKQTKQTINCAIWG